MPALLGAGSVASAEPVRLAVHVPVDDTELFMQIRGADRSAPVVLWLHGGPGGAQRPLFRLFNGALEQHLVSAYLDQRGAGRSFDPEADPESLTIDTHLADLDRVVDHLAAELGQHQVVLLGHSWGGALALLYAQRQPQKVSHVIAVAPLIDTRASWQAGYAFIRTEAARRDDQQTLAALDEIGAPPHASVAEVLETERLMTRYGGVFHQPLCRMCVLARGTFRGLVTPWEVGRFIRGNRVSLEAMHAELAQVNLFQQVPRLEVPVTFLLGRYDFHVSSDVAAAYAEVLKAPAKQVVWFPDSAHNPPFEEPGRFHDVVIETLGIAPDPPTSP